MWHLLLLIGAFSAFAEATVHRFDREKVYRVTPRNEDEVHTLNYLANIMQVDFWRPDSVELVKAEMTVDFRIEADRCSEVERILQHRGLNYEILIDNLQTALDRQLDNHARVAGYHYEKYNSWEKIDAWTNDIANENPRLVSRLQIGTTFEGRPMPLLKIGNPGQNKKAIFIDCGFHAREWISPAFCQWFVREAVRTYGKETIMTRLLNNLDFYVLPVLNIDGYVYSWTKSRMWRKTRSVNAGSKCIGTDPNRNFDAAWCDVGASTNPCSETYCGSKPESEKETKALADFIRRNLSTIKAYLTIHSYSQMLLYPYSYTYNLTPNNAKLLPEIEKWSRTAAQFRQIYNLSQVEISGFGPETENMRMGFGGEILKSAPNGKWVLSLCSRAKWKPWQIRVKNSIAKGAIRELATLYGTKYTYGPGAATIYPAAGGSDDWAYDQGIEYSFTFELRDTGRYGFALPESQIKPTCEETMIAVKYIAEYILNY